MEKIELDLNVLKAQVEQLQILYNSFLQERLLSVNGKTQQHVLLDKNDIIGLPSTKDLETSLKEDSYILTEDGTPLRAFNSLLKDLLKNLDINTPLGDSSQLSIKDLSALPKEVSTIYTETGQNLREVLQEIKNQIGQSIVSVNGKKGSSLELSLKDFKDYSELFTEEDFKELTKEDTKILLKTGETLRDFLIKLENTLNQKVISVNGVEGSIIELKRKDIKDFPTDSEISQIPKDDSTIATYTGYSLKDYLKNLDKTFNSLERNLSQKIQEVKEGFLHFKTVKELLASTPNENGLLAKAWDTLEVYQWLGSSWSLFGKAPLDEVKDYIKDLNVFKTEGYPWSVQDAKGSVALAVTDQGAVKIGDVEIVKQSPDSAIVLAEDSKGAVAVSIDKEGSLLLGNTRCTPSINFSVEDSVGNTAIEVSSNGDVSLGACSVNTASSPYPWSVKDSYGNIAIALDKNGKFLSFYKEVSSKKAPWHKADIMMTASLGQSLSRGRNSLPVKNTTQPFKNITFTSGELNNGSKGVYTGFKPLIGEAIDANYGESPNIWHLNKFVEKQVAKGDSPEEWVFLGTAPQLGGTPMEGLNKGSTGYRYFTDQLAAAYALAQSQGKTFVNSHNTWTQGENDYTLNTSKDAYKLDLISLKNDIAEDAMSITKQSFRPILITYQCPAHRNYGGNKDYNAVAQAQLEASNEDSEIFMATPIYHLKFHTDNVHLTSDGSQQLGYYYARVSEKVLVEKKDWKPLQPSSFLIQDKILDVTFIVPQGPLVFDTETVALASNFGFDIWLGNTLLDIIESVTITDKNRVKIILKEAFPEGATLSYARGRAEEGTVTSSANRPRGNLRDSAGTSDFYTNTSGETTYLHNWCVMFNITSSFGE